MTIPISGGGHVPPPSSNPMEGIQDESNPPATEQTLNITGVSVTTWKAPNGALLYLPVGHSTQGHNDNTPSEAWGYAMRNAVAANDKTAFVNFAQSYLYFCTQSASTQSGLFGLMGWNPNMTSGSYKTTSYATSASDADEDIIASLIGGLKAFGNVQLSNPADPQGSHSPIALQQLALQACDSFVKGDIGSFNVGGKTYDPVLTLDNWGHDAVNPDYFDPTTFANIIGFLQDNNSSGTYTQDISTLQKAAQNTMQFLTDIASSSGGWIPDGPWNVPAKGTNFGYDATRILMRMGEFIASPNASTLFGADFYKQSVTLLQNLVKNIMPFVNSQGKFTPSGLCGGCFTGPLLLAVTALNKVGSSTYDTKTISSYFQKDMTNYDTADGTSGWQLNGYFNIQLGVLSEAIMKTLGIYPG